MNKIQVLIHAKLLTWYQSSESLITSSLADNDFFFFPSDLFYSDRSIKFGWSFGRSSRGCFLPFLPSSLWEPQLCRCNAWDGAKQLSILAKIFPSGFLDGTVPKPSPVDPLYLPWTRCNNFIVAWLLWSNFPSIASIVFYLKDTN